MRATGSLLFLLAAGAAAAQHTYTPSDIEGTTFSRVVLPARWQRRR
jgi:hypothetical protein